MRRLLTLALTFLLPALSFAQAGPVPGGSGGGSSTITSGTTVTSGCLGAGGGVLVSISNQVRCDFDLAYTDGATDYFTLGGSTGVRLFYTNSNIAGIGASASQTYMRIGMGTVGLTIMDQTLATNYGFWTPTGLRVGDATTPTAAFEVTNGAAAKGIMTLFDNTTPVLTVADGGAVTATGALNLTTSGYIYGDNTTPHIRLNSGAGSFFGYGTHELTCAGSYCGPYDGGFTARFPTVTTAITTGGTISGGTQQEYRSVIHSYTWANAQVTGLGAVTSGEWIAFTLPAKTKLENLYVIITGAAAGPTTVTVSCGRTGTDYIDYIVASDAKAAANTIYGNDTAERGTNLTGYDLPSYTGTTSVRCQFISTGANLNTVTGSAGTIVVETVLIP